MLTSTQHIQHTATKRCAACGGKFGLVRHYSCRLQLCSKECVGRVRNRRDSDRRWLRYFRAA
jgi:hypothetical protein